MEGFGGGSGAGFAEMLKKMMGSKGSSPSAAGGGDQTKKIFDALSGMGGKKKEPEAQSSEPQQVNVTAKLPEMIVRNIPAPTSAEGPKNVLKSNLMDFNIIDDEEEKKKKLFLA